MSNPTAPLLHALSFDIEDWFHMVEIEAVEDSKLWPTLPSLVEVSLPSDGIYAAVYSLSDKMVLDYQAWQPIHQRHDDYSLRQNNSLVECQ